MDLRAEIRAKNAEIAMLRGKLAAAGIDAEPQPTWANNLTPAEAAIVGALVLRHPRWVDRYTLEEASRTRDHAVERYIDIVDVIVCKVRKKLPEGAIECVRGRGYRISDAFAATARDEAD